MQEQQTKLNAVLSASVNALINQGLSTNEVARMLGILEAELKTVKGENKF